MKRCNTCNKTKSLDEFQKRSRNRDGHTNQCKECKREYDNAHYASHPNRKIYIRENSNKRRKKVSEWVWEYLMSNPCIDCGETDPVVLEFDHIDPNEKLHNVSTLRQNGNLETVKAEVSKCEVRCANCHRRRTARQFGWHYLKVD